MGQLPLAPPAILSPRVVCVALEREVATASAASLATGITALLAARVSHLSLNNVLLSFVALLLLLIKGLWILNDMKIIFQIRIAVSS